MSDYLAERSAKIIAARIARAPGNAHISPGSEAARSAQSNLAASGTSRATTEVSRFSPKSRDFKKADRCDSG
jgi:hypothetical protein